MARRSAVKHKLPPKPPRGQPATREAAHRARRVWVGWRTSGPVHPVILRGEQPGSKPTTPKPSFPARCGRSADSTRARYAGYADEHGLDVPDTRGWTTKIGTDFRAEMIETVEQDRWTD